MPIYFSATHLFLFILFGSFRDRAGMIRLFTDVSLGLFGGTRGGPAKVAVFASGMMGTISGSGVANVVTVGQFTIPLMIKFGYRRAFAAGVEATASMGGQIMPPVMGAVAFIMAEPLGVDYSVIVKAAGIVSGQSVVEVGPGLGSLTLGLLETGPSVVAVEIDTRSAPHLAVPAKQVQPGPPPDLHPPAAVTSPAVTGRRPRRTAAPVGGRVWLGGRAPPNAGRPATKAVRRPRSPSRGGT